MAEVVSRMCARVYLLVVAHLLWVAGTLLGLVVMGAGPATFALYTIVSSPAEDVSARVLARRFLSVYRERFWKANALWGLYFAGAAVVALGSIAVDALPGASSVICRAALVSAGIAIGISALMASPAAERVGLPASPVAALRQSLLYGIARFPVTLVGLLAAAAVVIAVLQIPGLALALGPNAVFAFIAVLEARHARIRAQDEVPQNAV